MQSPSWLKDRWTFFFGEGPVHFVLVAAGCFGKTLVAVAELGLEGCKVDLFASQDGQAGGKYKVPILA